MLLRKIIANNFIYPGEQVFEYDNNNLIDGTYYSLEHLVDIIDLFNGEWRNDKLSFARWYPKFVKRTDNMDLNIDALIVLSDDELKEMNDLISNFNFKRQKSKIWYYSIKCIYPYIFPIVTLIPADYKKDDIIPIGGHYEKFFKDFYSKREIIITKIISTIGALREEYFAIGDLLNETSKDKIISGEEKQHKLKLQKLLLSILRHEDIFIKKLAKLTISFPEGDVAHFGSEKQYFANSQDVIDLLQENTDLAANEKLRNDFIDIMWKHYFYDLGFMFGTKSSVDILELARILQKNYCERGVNSKELIDFLFLNVGTKNIGSRDGVKTKKLLISELDIIDKKINNVKPFFPIEDEDDILQQFRIEEERKRRKIVPLTILRRMEPESLDQENESRKLSKPKKIENKTANKPSKKILNKKANIVAKKSNIINKNSSKAKIIAQKTISRRPATSQKFNSSIIKKNSKPIIKKSVVSKKVIPINQPKRVSPAKMVYDASKRPIINLEDIVVVEKTSKIVKTKPTNTKPRTQTVSKPKNTSAKTSVNKQKISDREDNNFNTKSEINNMYKLPEKGEDWILPEKVNDITKNRKYK
ncbi:hypothetical protein [Spiroplasma endosymbiont of Aspidapion aeneum]|uniref:hypothetical protein n=1 Tax=Spiroplasma endosymbiont of Aspidapion aeneum TaxID=3066276 RepID=UPI00313EE5D1